MKRIFIVLIMASLLTILGSTAYGSFIGKTTQNTANQNIQPLLGGSSQNYTLQYGTLGLGKSQGTTANYTLESFMPNQPTGKHNSTNYRLYLGPHYIKTLKPPPTPPVGGIWTPVDKLALLAPYIGLTLTVVLAIFASAAYIKYRKKQ